jgi:hypothetical protein
VQPQLGRPSPHLGRVQSDQRTDTVADTKTAPPISGIAVDIADKIVEHGADYRLGLKGNQPILAVDTGLYFDAAPDAELAEKTTVEKGHGRIERRADAASSHVAWIRPDRNHSRAPRFSNIKTLVKVHARVEYPDRCSFETRDCISSAPCDIERLAAGIRGHRGVESMHWLLDGQFKDDLIRYRVGNGAKNMVTLRRFAVSLVRANNRREASNPDARPPDGAQTSSSKSCNSNDR